MYTHSGRVKANKKDIEAIKVFIDHAAIDMSYGGGGSYKDHGSLENRLDERELKKGQLGLENVVFMLEALCDKWPKEN